MNGRALNYFLMILVLAAVGAALGLLAGPAMARHNYIVQVAERVWLEESQGLTERTLQSNAFRATAMPPASLYAQAREVRDRFRLGGMLFGLWCGLVAALKIASVMHDRARRIYDADPADCLACARCYLSCPVELERRKERGQ